MMAAARDPWWVIGSAAVLMLGAETGVADIDVLLSTADADAIDARLGIGLQDDAGDDRFRSARFGRWYGTAIPVEFMADLKVCGIPLRPATRVAMRVGGATLFHPDRAEMVEILDRFGRPKDRARAALLGHRGTGLASRARDGFIVQHDVLKALDGAAPDADAATTARRHVGAIERVGTVALSTVSNRIV